jgi:aspartyl-tRNA(Asn)/glutamyl-tRNA(Gln) amidotransferase subunit A
MAGQDPHDGTTWPESVPNYADTLHRDMRGLRIGVPEEYFVEGLDAEVEKALRTALQTFVDLGAEIVDIHLPHSDYALPVYYLIAPAEASSNLARFDGVRYGYRETGDTIVELFSRTRGTGFGPEVTRRIMLGTYARSAGYYDAYYLKAQKVRTLIKDDFDKAFEHVDVIVGPTSPVTAFKLGERADDPLQMYLADIFTLSQALAGIPTLSQPCGFDSNGLPIGLQIAAPTLQEARMFQVAYAYEQATEWHTRKPRLDS